MSSIKKASDLIKAIFDDIKLDHGEEYYSLFSGWERTVGTDLASHSRVREIEKGNLIVEVDHPGWAQMIQLRKAKVLAACKKEYPDLGIKGIRIVIDREGTGMKPRTPPEPPGVPEEEPQDEKPEHRAGKKNFDDLLKRLEHTVKDREEPLH